MNYKKPTREFIISLAVLITLMLLVNISISVEYVYIYVAIFFAMVIALREVLFRNIFNTYGHYKEVDKRTLSLIISFLTAYIILIVLLSSNLVSANSLAKSINPVSESKENFKFSKTRTVTRNMAISIASKVIGVKQNGVQISSQYEIDKDMTSIQIFKNELVWILPLDYSGFTKWLKQDYVPGYIVVSATNPDKKAKLVLDRKVKYSNNSFFTSNINRIFQIKSGFKKFSIHYEVNDNGTPFYICTIIKPINFMAGYKASEILLLNAETGDLKELTLKEAAKLSWLDKIYPGKIAEIQIEWYGKYINGLSNFLFGGENINVPTTYNGSEVWFVTTEDNQTWYFTGMTSVNKNDSSLVEGMLYNTKTGEVKSFDLSGVMDESGAISVITSSLGADSIRWEAVLPQPIIINNDFYWGASVISKNNSHIYQEYIIVKGNDQSKVFRAHNPEEAIKRVLMDNQIINKGGNSTLNRKEYLMNQILLKIKELNKLREELNSI